MKDRLARHLGLAALIIYGIGDILGAGIYALVGKVIGVAGEGAWLTFIFSALVALVTGFSYAEMVARYPAAAGAAVFVRRAFSGKLMATLAGVLVLGTGLTSAATVTVAFSGYLKEVFPIPDAVAQMGLLGFMTFFSFWGIRESSRLNMVLTAFESAGLLAVIAAGFSLFSPESAAAFWQRSVENTDLGAVLTGVTLAFYAYIGFEDLCNLAEEAKNPAKDLPRAILTAIGVSTIVYILVTLALMLTVPSAEVSQSPTPLLLVFEKAGWEGVPRFFSFIAMMAIANTGLINLIMASRLMYGMAQEGLMPSSLSAVHAGRKTPWVAIMTTFIGVLILVFTGGVKVLAQTTSLLIMIVFFLVHLSLIRVKRSGVLHDGMRVPTVVPVVGVLLTLAFIVQFPIEVYARSLLVIGIGLLLWFIQRSR